jgi:hypothetical protein
MHVEFHMTAVWKDDWFQKGSRRGFVDCQPVNCEAKRRLALEKLG